MRIATQQGMGNPSRSTRDDGITAGRCADLETSPTGSPTDPPSAEHACRCRLRETLLTGEFRRGWRLR
jgi:hypothetical protein